MTVISCKNPIKNMNETEFVVPKEEMITFGDTSNQLMKEDEFWDLISEAREKGKKDYEGQTKALKAILSAHDLSYITKYANTFYKLLEGSYTSDLWGAAYVINGGCSDDCFDYFREYLIAKGKSKFYKTLKDPDSCGDWIKTESQENWQGFGYAAFEVYKEKTGKDIKLTIPIKMELKGELFDESKLGKKYPKLHAKFNQ